MASRAFLNTTVLNSFLSLEPYILLGLLVLSGWGFYKVFLKGVSDARHRSLRLHYRALTKNFIGLSLLMIGHTILRDCPVEWTWCFRLAPYVALAAILLGMVIFVKACRTWVLQYLFLKSMQEGVPLLIVNVFSLALSIGLGFWLASRVFELQLGPLLATSAALSVVLGLAMQETLGNLFAGISLQLEKNFEIGDWLEILNGTQKTVGQVKEISWRSVLLSGFSDELITIPNRVMAQALIFNFSPPDQPIVRSQVFRLPFDAPVDAARTVLEKGAAELAGVRGLPAPFAFVQEATDSWVAVKLVYFIDSYGSQFLIGDKVLRKGLEVLRKHGIELARQEFRVTQIGDHP